MSLLDDVAIHLRDNGIGGFPNTTQVTDTGWTIVRSFMPSDPDRVIALYETGGREPEAIPELNYPRFQVRARAFSSGYSTAREKMYDCEDLLHAVTNQLLNDVYYVRMHQLGDAQSLGFDREDRPLFGQFYQALQGREVLGYLDLNATSEWALANNLSERDGYFASTDTLSATSVLAVDTTSTGVKIVLHGPNHRAEFFG